MATNAPHIVRLYLHQRTHEHAEVEVTAEAPACVMVDFVCYGAMGKESGRSSHPGKAFIVDLISPLDPPPYLNNREWKVARQTIKTVLENRLNIGVRLRQGCLVNDATKEE